MKSHSIEWNAIEQPKPAFEIGPAERLNRLHQVAAKLLVAVVPALAILVVAAFLASSAGLSVYLQAALWASGFVFLGLALDAEKRAAMAAAAMGVGLPTLAYLSARAGIEFALVAAALVAAWVAVAIFRR
jgi:hypothetical protein